VVTLKGFWSSLIAEQLASSGLAEQLPPATAYLITHGVGHLIIPLLEAVLLVIIVRRVAAAVSCAGLDGRARDAAAAALLLACNLLALPLSAHGSLRASLELLRPLANAPTRCRALTTRRSRRVPARRPRGVRTTQSGPCSGRRWGCCRARSRALQ
jgi:hypothetical protein